MLLLRVTSITKAVSYTHLDVYKRQSQRWALMTETPDEEEVDLAWLVSRMDASTLDLILVEGFKHEPVAKLLLFRQQGGHRVEAVSYTHLDVYKRQVL